MHPQGPGYPTQLGATNAVPSYTAFPAEKPISAFDGLNGRLNGQVCRAWELVDRARRIADDVFGPAGEKGSAATTGAPPALGRYSALATSLDGLDFALSELTGQIERLTCI